MSYIIDDQRKTTQDLPMFVVATDSFMSGWGRAAGRSLFALEIGPDDNANLMLAKMHSRSDMKRPRIVGRKKDSESGRWIPSCRLRDGDHLSIRDRKEAASWYA